MSKFNRKQVCYRFKEDTRNSIELWAARLGATKTAFIEAELANRIKQLEQYWEEYNELSKNNQQQTN
jgi:hypothetical protein